MLKDFTMFLLCAENAVVPTPSAQLDIHNYPLKGLQLPVEVSQPASSFALEFLRGIEKLNQPSDLVPILPNHGS